MAYNEASKRATIKYVKANYDRIEIKVPKGCKSLVEAYATDKGESVNGLVNALLRTEMGLAEWPERKRQEDETC